MPDDSTFSSVVPHFLFLLILAFVIDIGTSYLPDYKLLLNEESFSFSMLLQLLMMILSSMLALILLCSVALCGVASPVVQEQAASELASIYYAVDLSTPLPTSIFKCMQPTVPYAFLRVYSPAGQGELDVIGCSNIKNANAAGMKTEAYMTPQPKSSKTGAQQFDEMYGGLRNSYINILSIWVQVTSPVNWHASTTKNVDFLNSILTRARQYGLGVGVYTNVYEWNEITGGATADNVLLWYWNVYGAGTSNESPATFSDFHSFAGWTVPTAKQYGQVGSVCGVDVNKDIISISSVSESVGMAKHENSDQIVVGSLGLGSIAPGKSEIKQ